MTVKKNLYILIALILAWSVDFLLLFKPSGANIPLLFALTIIAMFLLALWERKRIPFSSLVLAILTQLLALAPVLRSESFSVGLPLLMAFACLALLTATLLSGNWLFYRISDTFMAALRFVAAALTRGPGMILTRSTAETPAKPASWRGMFAVLRGLLLALPVLLVLSALLAAADPVFGNYVKRFFGIFTDFDQLAEIIQRIVMIIILAYLGLGLLLHALDPRPVEDRPDPNQPLPIRFLGTTEAYIVLGSVTVLFILFLITQVPYLFGGQMNIAQNGFTYAEYARKGFFELVWVAVLSFLVYLTLAAITRREEPRGRVVFSVLAVALFACVLVILLSALKRITMYEEAYGFTHLRTITHIFIYWLALLLVATIVLEVIQKPGHLGLTFLLVALGFASTFLVINLDQFIVERNLAHARVTGDLDLTFLASLSPDAVAALAEAYQHPASVEEKEQLYMVLGCLRKQQDRFYAPTRDWRSASASHTAMKTGFAAAGMESLESVDKLPWDKWELQGFNCWQSGFFD